MIKRKLLIILFVLLLIPLSSSLVFKQNEIVNYSFRCFDSDGNYCTSAADCVISIEAPNGTNLYDNVSMTFHSTHFSFILPTHTNGKYGGLAVCSSENITTAEFTYLVTPSGNEKPTSGEGTTLIISIASMFLISLLFFFISNSFKGDSSAASGSREANGNPAARFVFIALAVIIAVIAVLYSSVSLMETFWGFNKIIESYGIFIYIILAILFLLFIFILINLTIRAIESMKIKRGLIRRR